jgi:hypothetical protein
MQPTPGLIAYVILLLGAIASPSVAVAVYTTVLAAAFSATLAVGPLVNTGLKSFAGVTVIVPATNVSE